MEGSALEPRPQGAGLDARANALLAALPEDRWRAWSAHLELVHLAAGQLVYAPGQPIRHVHFPLSCVISTETMLSDGRCTQAGLIGYEGLCGVPGLLSGASTTIRAVVQTAGHAARVDSSVVAGDLFSEGPVARLLHRYLQALWVQAAQNAACQRHHSPEEQVCSLLLRTSDRARSDDLAITQEALASMLGLRRETVTQAAVKLQAKGYLHYKRGKLHILDRPALEREACECYGAVRRAYDALLRMP